MNEKLLAISGRIRELRDILGISALSISKKINVPYENYLQYENGTLDIPISILYEIADQLGTDMTVLLTGDSPRMDTHSIVRANHGVEVERFPGYSFLSLAFNFKNRDLEPLLVTIDPEKDIAAPVTHGGQEFNYILEGSVKVVLGKNSYILNAGDSIYFDPSIPHAQRAVNGVAKFLTIIERGKEKTVEKHS